MGFMSQAEGLGQALASFAMNRKTATHEDWEGAREKKGAICCQPNKPWAVCSEKVSDVSRPATN